MGKKRELTGKPGLMRELNIGLLGDALAKHGMATRVELSEMTGISQPTVNELIRQLLRENVVVSVGMTKSTRGRRAEVFALNHRRSGILSVLVKEHSLAYTVTDLDLNRQASGETARNVRIACREQLCMVIRQICEKYAYIGAIAVGVPGAVLTDGSVFAIPEVPEWENFNLKKYLEAEFSMPVAVMNDINAIAVGHSGNSEDKAGDMVYLHVGKTGIGAGIIIHGELYPGYKSFAGEVGHMQLGDSWSRAEEREGRPETDRFRAELIQKMVINIICVLNPERIVLGGEDVPEELFAHVREECGKHLPEEIIPEFVIMRSSTEYYFKGLGKIGRELLDGHIRLA